MKNTSFSKALLGLSTVAIAATAAAQTYTYAPPSTPADWNAPATWGLESGFPNAAGVTIEKTSGGGSTLTQNVAAGVTVGVIEMIGNAATNTWVIATPTALRLNNNGNGAVIRHAAHSNARIDISNGNAGLILEDNLLVVNENGTGSGSILLRSPINGTGNITFDNQASNDHTAGQIRVEAASGFTGSVTIARGAVTYNNQSAFGGVGNALALGTVGAATLMNNAGGGSNVSTANNITVGSFGATIGSTGTTGTLNTIFSGTVALNGNLAVNSSRTGDAAVLLSGVVSGTGNFSTTGTSGNTRLSAVNTYTGNTTVAAGTTLQLTSTSELRFSLQDGGVSNQVSGTGSVVFDGLFRLDASSFSGSEASWTLVNVGTLGDTFGSSFNLAFVGGGSNFTNEGSGLYTSGDWSFNTATGALTLVPEPGTWVLIICGLLIMTVWYPRRRLAIRD